MKTESSGLSMLWFLLFCWGAWVLLSDGWHSKARYSMQYEVDYDHVFVNDEPTDCNFMRAPLGTKGCHYDRIVQTRYIRTRTLSTLPLPKAPCDPSETLFTSGGSAWMRSPDGTYCLGPTVPAEKVAAMLAKGYVPVPADVVEASITRGYIDITPSVSVTEFSDDEGKTWVPDPGDTDKSAVFVVWHKVDE